VFRSWWPIAAANLVNRWLRRRRDRAAEPPRSR
jgi:hypothetical protein